MYGQKEDLIKGAISETQRIYQTHFFPEMKTNWQTHPNNIGHLYSSGCFRVNLSFGNKIICPSITLNPAAGGLLTTEIFTSYSQTFAATGGCASSFTFSVTSGVLPPGLTLGANGALSGTTRQFGTYNFTVAATDNCGCSQSQNYTLTVLPNWDLFRRGMNEYCIWGGAGGSYNSSTQIDNPYSQTPIGGTNLPFRQNNISGVRYGSFGLCYGRILYANDRFAFKYTFNAIPVAVLSYRDFNRDLGIPVPGSEIRRNVLGRDSLHSVSNSIFARKVASSRSLARAEGLSLSPIRSRG